MTEYTTCPDCHHRVTDHTSSGCFWQYNCDCKLTNKECLEKALDKRKTKG